MPAKKAVAKKSKVKQKPRRGARRGQDRERAQRSLAEHVASSLWAQVRDTYPPKVRAFADRVAERGITLADLLVLEAAEHVRLQGFVDAAVELVDDDDKRVGHKTLAALTSVQLQTRKHMRTIILAMGPQLSVNNQPVRVPEGLDLETLLREEREMYENPDEILS